MIIDSNWVKILDNYSGTIINTDNLGRTSPASVMLKESLILPATYEDVMYLAEGDELVVGRCTLWALFEGRADIYITPGDTMVFTMHRETGQSMNAGVTFEFSDDI